MFGLGHTELIVILVIVLVLFGAKRLPELGGSLGRGIRSFRSATRGALDEEPTPPAKKALPSAQPRADAPTAPTASRLDRGSISQ